MKTIKRLLVFAFILLLYFIGKEFLVLYLSLYEIYPILAYLFIIGSLVFIVYFAVYPIYQIIKIPVNLGPTKDPSKVEELRGIRIEAFKNNNYLKSSNFNLSNLENSQETYDKIIAELSKECQSIRKKYVNSLFYSSSIAQNGFIDAILILSTSVNLVKEIFILYNGRTNKRDLFVIAKKVYYSIIIGGTEGAEHAAEEIFSKLATDTVKSIPFLDKIFASLADGFINATLLTRVSLITENYCTKLYIESDKDLYPSVQSVTSTVKHLTSGAFKKINENLIKLAKERSEAFIETVLNPVTLVFNKTYNYITQPKEYKADNRFKNLMKGISRKIKHIKNPRISY